MYRPNSKVHSPVGLTQRRLDEAKERIEKMDNNNNKKNEKKGSSIGGIIAFVIALLVFAGDAGGEIFGVIVIVAVIAVIVYASSAAKKRQEKEGGTAEITRDDLKSAAETGLTKVMTQMKKLAEYDDDEHDTSDHEDIDHFSDTLTEDEKLERQLKSMLKNGIIEKDEYNILRRKFNL